MPADHPEPTRVLLVRHGQSAWNAEGRWQGHADPPLSPLGVQQAVAAADSVGAVDAVVASDLQRAATTATLIAERLGVGPVRCEPRLRERDAGEWTGLTRADIDEQWPGYLADGRRPSGFELDDAILGRILEALAALHQEHPGGRVLAVAHGGVIRALERQFGNGFFVFFFFFFFCAWLDYVLLNRVKAARSRKTLGSELAYTYRFSCPPSKRIGSLAVHRPVVGSSSRAPNRTRRGVQQPACNPNGTSSTPNFVAWMSPFPNSSKSIRVSTGPPLSETTIRTLPR